MKGGPVGQTQPMAEINMIPLVDVMLVLLVIFIITAPLMTQAVPVDLPRVESTPIEDAPRVLELVLDESDQLHFNGEQVGYETLLELLANIASEPGLKPSLHLRAWRGARYERVTLLMAAAQRVGITKIAFVTEGAAANLQWDAKGS
ncbi:MAG: biopolymer transporter ExbD [Rhodocyclaceae bacterium]|nr:biopolymer transporter ExbD [Rhodocyclaceae bacterium]MCL4759290.1 biopolymer transporter ExbD [Rhodocyclaceae bacterium]